MAIVKFEVGSACNVGYFGKNCTSPCPTNCKTGECHVQSGQCTGGCNAGYDGVKCENASPSCYKGKIYIEGRSEKCKSKRCVSKNGTCPEGCKPGYEGDKCDRR
ncbi:hypothetical protein Btru_026754 [Bulinus truncatus]|nr:hypothetical protein Btru_026754 [Bulinus truncatus]